MGSECRDDPHGAIQSLLTYSGPIRAVWLLTRPARFQKWVLVEGETAATQVLRNGTSEVVIVKV